MNRNIDDKFEIKIVDGSPQIVKKSNGEILPLDEPLFLLRARDKLAIPLIEHYLYLCIVDGCNNYQLDTLRLLLERFYKFMDENPKKMKQPGITRGL